MSDKNDLKYESTPLYPHAAPTTGARHHANKITEDAVENSSASSPNSDDPNNEQYSLNDDRRVQVLSPGALVAKRFFRNRLAVTGMIILLAMFAFSFIGGLISPYKQDQKFYRIDLQEKDYAGVIKNSDFVYTVADDVFKGPVQAQTLLNIMRGNESFDYNDNPYDLEKINDDLYVVSVGGKFVGLASKETVNASSADGKFSADFTRAALLANANGEDSFEAEGQTNTLRSDISDRAFKENGGEALIGSALTVRYEPGNTKNALIKMNL